MTNHWLNRFTPKQRRAMEITLGLVLLALLAAFFWPRGGGKDTITGENLLDDGGFSAYAVQRESAWYTDAYVNREDYTSYEVLTEADGTAVAHIVNALPNDARFAQTVDVKPDSLYCLEGDVRSLATGGLGANLSVEGPYVFSESLYDQAEWTHLRLYGRTGEAQRSVTVFARLGGYSGEAVGEAWFRNLSLTEVEEVPEGYHVYNWYRASESKPSGNNGTAGGTGFGAHAALMALALAAYGCLAALTLRRADRTRRLESGSLLVLALYAAALLVRLVLAVAVHGYDIDVGDFCAWATDVAAKGPASFYGAGFCDYPPGYILVLGVVGLIGRGLEIGVTEFMIKIPPILADLATAWLIHRAFTDKKEGKGRRGEETPFSLCVLALLLFNPMILLTGAGWGQSDSVMMLFLTLTVIFALRRRWSFALPFYVLAVLMKPQALMFGPMGLAALYIQYREDRGNDAALKDMLREFLIGFGAMLAAAAAIVIPFSTGRGIGWLFELYGRTMSYYDNATVNACNLYFLAGGNFANIAWEAPRWFGTLALAVLGLPAGYGCLKQRHEPWWKSVIPLAVLAVTVLLAVIGWVFPLTWQFWSMALMAVVIVMSLALFIQAGQLRHLPLYGGMLILGLFALGGMMHERYIFPAVILLFWAWRLEDDDRILLCLLLATAGALLNAGCVLSGNQRIGGAEGHLTMPAYSHVSDMAVLEYLSAAINVLAFALTALTGLTPDRTWHMSRADAAAPAAGAAAEEGRDSFADRVTREELTDDRPARRLDRTDLILVAAITLVYAGLAFWHLGSLTSPQTGYEFHVRYVANPLYDPEAAAAVEAGADGYDEEAWEGADATPLDPYVLERESVVFDLGEEPGEYRMLYISGLHQNLVNFTVETSDDGEAWRTPYECTLHIGDMFEWNYVHTYRGMRGLSMSGRYVRVTPRNEELNLLEVLFRTVEGQALTVRSVESSLGNDVSALCDEQDTLTGEPGWFNGMYFDEIYHARTAYEHLHGIYPYETTHPPLGKVMMSWCVGLFGMTPFGWRFAGTLAGVLMLPGLYLTARLLFRKRRYAILCALMLAFDTLHYTQTRLATIDSYVVLFIIWSFYFMFRWMYADFFGAQLSRTLVPLGLSGLMMGLAVASKWTGCYAGVGLAILFFLTVGRRWIAIRRAEKSNLSCERATAARNHGKMRLLITVASCLIFFVAVPAIIYYLSYIPYFAPSGGVTVERIVQAAEGMLSYHSEPGLGMDHPYYSPWYEWPFAVAKPMYYAADQYEPAGYASSILAFGNIGVWWVGLAALLAIMAAWLSQQLRGLLRGYPTEARASALAPRGVFDRRPAMLLIAFAAQYLPWMLVPRGTYIYHYFPSVPFIILCTGLVSEYLTDWAVERARSRALRRGADDRAAGRKADRLSLMALSVYIALILALFIAFFPYASGIMVRTEWLDAMNWFGNLYY